MKRLPSLVLLAISVGLVVVFWQPSASPDIYIFSAFRFVAIAAMVLAAVYFTVSLYFQTLLGANNMFCYTVVVGGMALEAVLRFFPALIPDTYLSLLPFEDGQEIAAQRGIFTMANVVGDGPLYYWKPNTRFPERPWITIDENGYYNNRPVGRRSDVVLLGASVVAAMAVEKNFSRLFHDSGTSAYSLAQGGPYGPFQFRDAYRRFIVEPGIKHRFVVILIILPNEFNKIHQYLRLTKEGKDYRDLFQASAISDIFPPFFAPWTLTMATKVPYMIPAFIERLRKSNDDVMLTVRLSGRSFTMPASLLQRPRFKERWAELKEALGDIFVTAKANGAQPLVLYYPLSPVLSMPFIKGNDEIVGNLKTYYRETVSRLETMVAELGGEFMDVTPDLRPALFNEEIMVTSGEYHLNQRGVEILFSVIQRRLKGMGL